MRKETHALLHRLWSECNTDRRYHLGKPVYRKADWIRLEGMLVRAELAHELMTAVADSDQRDAASLFAQLYQASIDGDQEQPVMGSSLFGARHTDAPWLAMWSILVSLGLVRANDLPERLRQHRDSQSG